MPPACSCEISCDRHLQRSCCGKMISLCSLSKTYTVGLVFRWLFMLGMKRHSVSVVMGFNVRHRRHSVGVAMGLYVGHRRHSVGVAMGFYVRHSRHRATVEMGFYVRHRRHSVGVA